MEKSLDLHTFQEGLQTFQAQGFMIVALQLKDAAPSTDFLSDWSLETG